jgi:glycosyltransferase involved in cell wall biosynthesis
MKLSVVVATLNRLQWLQKCVASIAPSCEGISREIIVVDGGSTDGTLEWLRGQDIVLIEQGMRLGAVKAFNDGFWAADGVYVAALNDDCVVVGPTLRLACEYLDTHEKCGQVAIPWHDIGDIDIAVQHVTIGRQQVKVIYANFGVTRRRLGDEVGWWGNWYHYSGDCELSFNVLMRGYTVDALPGGQIDHFRVQDSVRQICYYNPEFMQKWMTLDVSHLIKPKEKLGQPVLV